MNPQHVQSVVTEFVGIPTWLWLLFVGLSIGGGYLLGRWRAVAVAPVVDDNLPQRPKLPELEQALATQISMLDRYRRPFCLMFVACDRDQPPIDNEKWSDRLIETVRDTDVVCRLTPLQFAIVVTSTDLFGASQIGDRLCRDASLPSDLSLAATASIGLAAASPGDDPMTLMMRTEEALAVALDKGGDCVCRHTGDFVESVDFPPAPAGNLTAAYTSGTVVN